MYQCYISVRVLWSLVLVYVVLNQRCLVCQAIWINLTGSDHILNLTKTETKRLHILCDKVKDAAQSNTVTITPKTLKRAQLPLSKQSQKCYDLVMDQYEYTYMSPLPDWTHCQAVLWHTDVRNCLEKWGEQLIPPEAPSLCLAAVFS